MSPNSLRLRSLCARHSDCLGKCGHLEGRPAMEKELQQLIEELGDAINSSLSESDRFAAVMAEMEQAGYNVYVILEASIGFRKQGDAGGESGEAEIQMSPQPKHDSVRSSEMSEEDLDFLRELKISVA